MLVRFDSTTPFHSPSSVSRSGVRAPKPPAKAIRISAGPSLSSTSARRRATPSGVVRSAAIPATSPAGLARLGGHALDISFVAPADGDTRPLWPSNTRVAAPIPFEPPVTTATFPSRSGYVGTLT